MWFAVGPSAGGKPPLWQVEHWLATAIWLWFQVLGFQPETLWQLTQFALVGRWDAGLPVAALPLWQLAQLVALVVVLWSNLAPVKLTVVWQVSQPWVVATWPAGLTTLALAKRLPLV